MSDFTTALQARVTSIESQLCVGLDPRVDDARALEQACVPLARAVAPYAAAFKVNVAFFERFGAEGIAALERVIAALPAGPLVILDAKRGDIGDTMQAYADALDRLPRVGAITLSPYLGLSTFAPFLARSGLGVFILARTSNAGSAELQERRLEGGDTVAEHVARTVAAHPDAARLGLVAGATHPRAIAALRACAPDSWLLVPGVGAQGGDLDAALAAARRSDGLGALISVSRAIADAASPAAEAARLAAATWAGTSSPVESPEARRRSRLDGELAELLLRTGALRFGTFTLKSGASSPFYFDLRRIAGDAAALAWVGRALAELLRPLRFDRIAALPYAALPLGTAAALAAGKPLIYPRKEAKDYGTKAVVEGPFEPGETAVMLDDLITSGLSKTEALEKLRGAGLLVRDVVVVLERGGAVARAALAASGLTLHALSDAARIFAVLRGQVDDADLDRAVRYLEA